MASATSSIFDAIITKKEKVNCLLSNDTSAIPKDLFLTEDEKRPCSRSLEDDIVEAEEINQYYRMSVERVKVENDKDENPPVTDSSLEESLKICDEYDENESEEINSFIRSRTLRIYNFTFEDLANRRFLNILKRAPQVHIDIALPAAEMTVRYITPQDAQDAFRHLQDCKYGRPIRIIYDRDRLSCVVDWTLALDPGCKKVATDPEQEIADVIHSSVRMCPLSHRSIILRNVPPYLNDRQLAQYFPKAIGCWIAADTLKSKGYAYLEYRDQETAKQCLGKYSRGIQIGTTVMTAEPASGESSVPVTKPENSDDASSVLPFKPTKTFFVRPNFRGKGARQRQFGRITFCDNRDDKKNGNTLKRHHYTSNVTNGTKNNSSLTKKNHTIIHNTSHHSYLHSQDGTSWHRKRAFPNILNGHNYNNNNNINHNLLTNNNNNLSTSVIIPPHLLPARSSTSPPPPLNLSFPPPLPPPPPVTGVFSQNHFTTFNFRPPSPSAMIFIPPPLTQVSPMLNTHNRPISPPLPPLLSSTVSSLPPSFPSSTDSSSLPFTSYPPPPPPPPPLPSISPSSSDSFQSSSQETSLSSTGFQDSGESPSSMSSLSPSCLLPNNFDASLPPPPPPSSSPPPDFPEISTSRDAGTSLSAVIASITPMTSQSTMAQFTFPNDNHDTIMAGSNVVNNNANTSISAITGTSLLGENNLNVTSTSSGVLASHHYAQNNDSHYFNGNSYNSHLKENQTVDINNIDMHFTTTSHASCHTNHDGWVQSSSLYCNQVATREFEEINTKPMLMNGGDTV